MPQNTITKYRFYKWDTTCTEDEEFLKGLREDFRDKGFSNNDLPAYITEVICDNIDLQAVLIDRRRLTALLGVFIATRLSDRPIIRKYAYDAVMNMWEYMDGIYLQVYMQLSEEKERKEFLKKKRWQFFQWYTIYREYDASRFNKPLEKVIEIAQYIFFEWTYYTCPVVVMAYISIEVGKTDRK